MAARAVKAENAKADLTAMNSQLATFKANLEEFAAYVIYFLSLHHPLSNRLQHARTPIVHELTTPLLLMHAVRIGRILNGIHTFAGSSNKCVIWWVWMH